MRQIKKAKGSFRVFPSITFKHMHHFLALYCLCICTILICTYRCTYLHIIHNDIGAQKMHIRPQTRCHNFKAEILVVLHHFMLLSYSREAVYSVFWCLSQLKCLTLTPS